MSLSICSAFTLSVSSTPSWPAATLLEPCLAGWVGSLSSRWRGDAAVLRNRGASGHADTLEGCAAELEAAHQQHQLEQLTLTDVAREAGRSYSWAEKAVRSGRIPNAGAP